MVITFLIIDPAQAIDIEAVVGLNLQRALNQNFCFIEQDSHLGPGVTEIIQRGGILGLSSMAFFMLAMDFSLFLFSS